MKTLRTTTHIGPDGSLNLALPAMPDLAGVDADVLVVLSPVTPNGAGHSVDGAAWKEFVEQTAGQWQGEFVRADQGTLIC